ncbi:MAG: hypothetical protein KDI63_15445 [Gammaproteobacteria bacterium]|nr:hypothetical protein [Gammaproteobacteria bacterium]
MNKQYICKQRQINVMRSTYLSSQQRIALLIGVLIVSFIGLLFLEPIPQDPDYHLFADTRAFFGIPNFNDVISNAGFALVGSIGFISIIRMSRRLLFVQPGDARPYLVLFLGVALVSLGSTYYHWSPSTDRLLWDRLPMSVAFMAFAAAIVADRVHSRAGNSWLLLILTGLGLASLLYWDQTEQIGRSDLRFYAFVQFYPVLTLPLLLWLFPDHRYLPGKRIAWVFGWYGLSKVFEHYDVFIFKLLGYTVSGHTLKHLAASASAYVVLRTLSTGEGGR